MLQFRDFGTLCGKLQPWETVPQFFTLNIVTSISEAYRVQIERLQQQDKESQTKTQATLQRLRSLIQKLENIDLGDWLISYI